MANRDVNINIKYNVDSAQVQKAEQTLRQAQAASNNFQQSAQNAGKSTSQGFKYASLSIQEMNAKLVVLKDRILQSSDSKKVKQLSDEYKRLKTQLDAATKAAFDLGKANKEVDKSTQSLSNTFGDLYGAFKLILAAGVVKETVNMTLSMAKLSGNVEGVRNAFYRAFPDAEFLMTRLQKATNGTVGEFELMQRTLQATNLGVAVESLPVLFEFAAARAQQTGESVDYLVDSIVRGIGRKSLLILDNLGLSATRLKEEFNGASLASQSVAEVTRGVGRIAEVELTKMGGFAETAATKVDNLNASWLRLKETVAETATEGFGANIADGLNDLVSKYGDLFEAQNRGITLSELYAEKQRKEVAAISATEFMNRRFTDSKEQNNKVLEEEIKELTKSIGAWTKYRDFQNDLIKDLQKQYDETSAIDLGRKASIQEQIQLNERLRDAKKEDILIDQEILKILLATLAANLKRNDQIKEQLGLIEDLQQQIETLNDKIVKATSEGGIEKLNKQLVLLEARLKELQELGKNYVNPVGSLVYDIKKAVSELDDFELEFPLPTVDEDETTRLIKAIAKKQGEEFNKGLEESVEISSALQRAFYEAREELITGGIDIFANSLMMAQDLELESYQIRMQNLRDYYDEQQLLAGDNEKAKREIALREEQQTSRLRKQIAEKEKRARMFGIIIDTAAAIAKLWVNPGWPAAVPLTALVAAQGATQLAIASRASTNGFKDGVINLQGPGTSTSDSIPANLSKGESVMTAKETKGSMKILKEIRAKKLDDKILESLQLTPNGVHVVGMDDKNIVKSINELKASIPDVEARGNLLFTTRIKSQNYKQWVRKSSMSE